MKTNLLILPRALGWTQHVCIEKSSIRHRLKSCLYGMTVVALIEWVGALLGILGALLLAAKSSYIAAVDS